MSNTNNTETAVLFIGAKGPARGNEQQAQGFWQETYGWLQAQQKSGWLTRFDGFFLTPHGGDLNGAWVCYGERAKLDEWRRTDEFEAWVFKATSVLDGFGVIPGVTGQGIHNAMQRRNKILGNKV